MGKNFVIASLAVLLTWTVILLSWHRPSPHDPATAPEPPPVPPPPELPSRTAELHRLLAGIEGSPEFGAAALGFCLLDAGGEILVDHRADTGFIPASTLKTVTAATVLEILGPDFRFTTRLRAAAPAEEDATTIPGDLVIEGGGDPTLGLADLADWVDALRADGVATVEGAVVGDGSFFPATIADDFWNWGDVGNGYGSPASGLNLEHNRFTARFRPGTTEGEPAAFLGPDPEVPGAAFLNRVRTGPEGSGDGVMIYGGPDATLLRLEGTVPAGTDEFTVEGAVPDPPLFAAHHLDRLLREAGVAIGDPPRGRSEPPADGAAWTEDLPADPAPEAPPKLVDLLVHRSPPLSDIVRHLLEVSDNHESECLFRLLGVRAGEAPAEVVRAHWQARGLDLSASRMVDGSGLGRANFIAPRDLARLQFLARNGPAGEVYTASLNVHFGGAVRWKGGAMSSIRAYTGFITNAASGEVLTFALMVNHYPDAGAVSRWRDDIVRTVIEMP